MNQIPTALDFYRSNVENPAKGWSIEMAMKRFAEIHVKAALKAAAKIGDEYEGHKDMNNSILEAYSLDKIN